MTVQIRIAAPADAASLLALRRRLLAESNTMLWEAQEFVATEEDERHRVQQLTSKGNCTYMLASSEEGIVGLLFATGSPMKRLRHSTTLAVGVAREYEGQGIATRLVQSALVRSKDAGLRRVELTVHTSHLRAIRVYLRCGFQIEGVRRSSLLVDGRYVDEYVMSVVHSDV